MSLSNEIIEALKDELASLRRARRQIDAKIEGIRSLLRLENRSTDELDLSDVTALRSGSGAALGVRLPRGTLGASIAQTLQESPGLTAEQITEQLRKRGLTLAGKTSLRERVAHELRRMVRATKARREGSTFWLEDAAPDTRSRATEDSSAGALV